MADEEILHRIRTLVEEEHAVRSGNTAVDDERLAHLEETLDQCWDLLRQRRARREFGEDPSEAQVRGAGTVEHYQQ
jgi:DNA-binding transcriptional regulator PaaX